jgi:hypothetical protein
MLRFKFYHLQKFEERIRSNPIRVFIAYQNVDFSNLHESSDTRSFCHWLPQSWSIPLQQEQLHVSSGDSSPHHVGKQPKHLKSRDTCPTAKTGIILPTNIDPAPNMKTQTAPRKLCAGFAKLISGFPYKNRDRSHR